MWTSGIVPNIELELGITDCYSHLRKLAPDRCVIEMVQSFGMAVGRDVFETAYWVGRYAAAWDGTIIAAMGCTAERMFRKDIKLQVCGNFRAKGGEIRQSLIDRFGGKTIAIGKKATPGPLFGISSHKWSALAVAIAYVERGRETEEVPF